MIKKLLHVQSRISGYLVLDMRDFNFSLAICLTVLLLMGLYMSSCIIEKRQNNIIGYIIKREYLHNKQAFTQGLVMHEGKLFESTGSKSSWIAEWDLASGIYNKKAELSKEYFGEGITILNNKIYQLTWKNRTGFIYDQQTFKKLGQFNYYFDGWGITTDNKHLILSDGTEKLYYLDTLNFKILKILSIKYNNREVKKLNELEWVNGYIFANQWGKNHILKIDVTTEKVAGKIDVSRIVHKMKKKHSKAQAPNGIAYDKLTEELIITGKYWSNAYALQLKDILNNQNREEK